MKKWIKIFTFAYGQGPTPLTVSLTVKYPFFTPFNTSLTNNYFRDLIDETLADEDVNSKFSDVVADTELVMRKAWLCQS